MRAFFIQERLETRRLLSAVQTFTFDQLPPAGTTAAGQEVEMGGFSGLVFEGVSECTGNLQFITHTDRGPNAGEIGLLRPMLLPDFTPQIIRFELDSRTRELRLTERIPLETQNGDPLTGLSNLSIPGATANSPYNDEAPTDLFGNVLDSDPLGGDFEGMAVDPQNGTFWLVDEYRPSIYHFHKNGRLKERFVPVGTAAAAGLPEGSFGTEVLPAVLAQRRINRGFEGVVVQDGKVYAFMQSPLRNPVTLSNGNLNGMRNVRVVELDPKTGATRQFLYVLDNPNLGGATNTRADKIGDAAALGDGQFLVIERDDDAIDSDPADKIEKKVYRFTFEAATDLSGLPDLIDGKTVDQMTPAELAAAGVTPIAKTLHVDLAAAGYNAVEKVEGLAVLDAGTLAVINDNDFGVADVTLDLTTGTFTRNSPPEPIVLGLVATEPLSSWAGGTEHQEGPTATPLPPFWMGYDSTPGSESPFRLNVPSEAADRSSNWDNEEPALLTPGPGLLD
jgi:hypothetical protein